MRYVSFSLGFFLVHLGAYAVAGVLNQQLLARDLYGGDQALFAPFFRNMSDPAEERRISRLMVPIQLARALLMSVVLYPLLEPIGLLPHGLRFASLGGLMFVYADLAAATPFSDNLEPEFTTRDVFLRIGSEAVVYSLLFGAVTAWLLL